MVNKVTFTNYILHPTRVGPTKADKARALITSIAIGVLSLGTVHLVTWIAQCAGKKVTKLPDSNHRTPDNPLIKQSDLEILQSLPAVVFNDRSLRGQPKSFYLCAVVIDRQFPGIAVIGTDEEGNRLKESTDYPGFSLKDGKFSLMRNSSLGEFATLEEAFDEFKAKYQEEFPHIKNISDYTLQKPLNERVDAKPEDTHRLTSRYYRGAFAKTEEFKPSKTQNINVIYDLEKVGYVLVIPSFDKVNFDITVTPGQNDKPETFSVVFNGTTYTNTDPVDLAQAMSASLNAEWS